MVLGRHGVKGTLKVLGQKTRVLEKRLRHKAVEERNRHERPEVGHAAGRLRCPEPHGARKAGGMDSEADRLDGILR